MNALVFWGGGGSEGLNIYTPYFFIFEGLLKRTAENVYNIYKRERLNIYTPYF